MTNNDSKKKVIGTVIGIIFFVILIAGATFAWLEYTANVNNGVYNARTTNFLVNYTSGTDITDAPMLYGSFSKSEYTQAGGEFTTVVASKQAIDGTLYLKLHTNATSDSTALANKGCIRYAVCLQNGCDSDVPNDSLSTGILNSTNFDTNRDIVLYQGALTASSTTYEVYVWIDTSLIENEQVGLDYSGYIHAYAVQSELG